MERKYQIPNTKYQKNGGFTILEAIVAIFVLSLTISGVFAAVRQSLSQTIIAKEEVRAFYLAQEAIEIIRNKRDANRLSTIASGAVVNWLNGISADPSEPCYFGKTCKVDAFTNTMSACSGSWDSCEVLRQNPTTFLHGYDGSWPTSSFKREIQIEQVNANEVTVTVRVSWNKGLLSREFRAKTLLFNWI